MCAAAAFSLSVFLALLLLLLLLLLLATKLHAWDQHLFHVLYSFMPR
jgi:hypothetical protein